ncbi:hypothetical protein PG994_006266 [Apiospora phragmitis]|uniref:Uncharacterized protein n=1 Tax=Apiospora phragmitis TaxID=2905665 RepID=A0ABR1VHD6_9PEZI
MDRSEIGQETGVGTLSPSWTAHAEIREVTAFGLIESGISQSRRVGGMAVWPTVRDLDPDSPPPGAEWTCREIQPGAAWETKYLRATKWVTGSEGVEYGDELFFARCHP